MQNKQKQDHDNTMMTLAMLQTAGIMLMVIFTIAIHISLYNIWEKIR